MKNKAGYYRNNLSKDAQYQSFVPTSLLEKIEIKYDNEITNLLVEANKYIAILQSISFSIPDNSLFTSMYVRKEALLSSQIEGTQATLEDVFNPTIQTNTNRDLIDVINYVKAIEYAINRLNDLPLCNRLIKETHGILLKDARGQEKNPGEFRRSQNWIGNQNSSIKDARYIPPNPDDMEIAMSDLEKYINQDDDTDLLIKASLIHYQFETIHPFLDGNGRIGRLLITLFLIDKGVLTSPSLYISYFLKKNRIEYYDRMSEVRNKANYEQWIKFFLLAFIESSRDAIESIKELSKLNERNINKINEIKKSRIKLMVIYNYLLSHPIIDISKTSKALDLSYNTVSLAINKLEQLNILEKTNDNKRNKTFIYKEYLDILSKDTY